MKEHTDKYIKSIGKAMEEFATGDKTPYDENDMYP